ncbi:hypothetical protein AAL_08334 [Moelleriella libera RCEF 2490]|uniref:Uncharacterized protein n=1 Tax=Moelleriella libera RCEF 2490 TaxID=1081109 RepID=A0A167VKN0_9HYPO|nr:hypothetical protein AAL_08334 [Moelleriella libera RCEF 2490]
MFLTTLVVGREIIFASSVKKEDKIQLGPETTQHLDECGEGVHKNQERNNVNGNKLDKDSKAQIVAITKGRNANSGDSILAPYGDETNWGCNRLVKDLNILTDQMVSEDQRTSIFNWRQLKKENKLNIGHLPAVATDISTTPNLNGGSDKPLPKNRLKANK